MKKNMFLLGFALLFLTSFSQKTGTFKDARDKKVYKTITIGGQTIMAQNFAYKPAKGNCWAYDNDTANVSRYGYLYDWATAKKIAPPGWHLPTQDEWIKFTANFGKEAYDKISAGGGSGFDVAFAGQRTVEQAFSGEGTSAYFWISNPIEEGAVWGFYVYKSSKMSGQESYNPAAGFSVRLFKNK